MTTYHHFVTLQLEDGSMPMYVATPEGATEKHPVAFVIHGHGGVTPSDFAACDRFAEEGFVGVAPDLFYWGQKCFSANELDSRRNQLSDPSVIRAITSANAYFQRQSYVQPGKYGIIGFCMGGRVAFLMATGDPDNCGAAASHYGGGIMRGEGGPAPSSRFKEVRASLQVFHGDKDFHPPLDEILELDRVLSASGIPYELHRYTGFGHGYMGRKNAASEDAWPKMLAAFRMNIGIPTGQTCVRQMASSIT